MSDWTTTGAFVLVCILVLYTTRRRLASRSSCPLPPGPPGLPWVGNVIGVDATSPWLTYAEWARTYGDMVYSKLLGQDVIIINSEKAAKELLEKRSKNNSDRPPVIANGLEMLGLGFNSGLMPYNNRWRLHRQFFHQTFRLEAASRFLPLQHHKACQLLRQLFATPEQLDDHLFVYTASVILNSIYDYDPASREDEVVDMATKMITIIVTALRPDIAIMAGVLPFMLYLPSWFPGFSFKAVIHEHTKMYLDRPFEHYLRKVEMASGNVEPSLVNDGLKIMEEKENLSQGMGIKALKDAAGTAFLAASESSHSVLLTFFLMMMLNPDAQEKAQAQIDAVVGQTRLPKIEDRSLLPLVDAIFRETIRFNPTAPLSIPHSALTEDEYNGYRIPKGTMLLANVWWMAHDEARYPNPHAFLPERFLNDDGSLKPNDMEYLAYGFGRRICPGRHFADTSIWGVMAKVLAVFKILKPLDKNGKEITIEPKLTGGITLHPVPYKCRVVPRFPGMTADKLEELIAAV